MDLLYERKNQSMEVIFREHANIVVVMIIKNRINIFSQ